MTVEDRLRDARWELRVWGVPGTARERLDALDTEPETAEQDDCYLIGPRSGFSAKIRDGAVDVKELLERRQGLQRWAAAWNREPPHDRRTVDRLFVELGVPRPGLGEEARLSNSDLVGLVADHDRLAAVRAHKTRRHYQLGGVMGELTEMAIDGEGTAECVVIESTDFDLMVETRSSLALEGLPNVPVHVHISHLTSSGTS